MKPLLRRAFKVVDHVLAWAVIVIGLALAINSPYLWVQYGLSAFFVLATFVAGFFADRLRIHRLASNPPALKPEWMKLLSSGEYRSNMLDLRPYGDDKVIATMLLDRGHHIPHPFEGFSEFSPAIYRGRPHAN